MKKFALPVAALTATVALVVVPSLPAAADQGAAIIGSQAYYTTSDDQLSAWDSHSDGKSAIAEIRASSGSTIYSVVNSNGWNTTKYRTVSMPATYQIRACVQDLSAGGAKSCGNWVNGS